MAQEFLNQLLRLDNSIKSDSGQRCMICLEECGSLSSETGIIECLMRLPCSHLVGSHCVATWLHDHNTCPVCRSVFFPARPRPFLEHGITQGDGADDASDDDTDGDSEEEHDDDDQGRLNRLARNTRWSSHRLGLNYAARRLAHLIARRAFHMDGLPHCTQWSKAAVSVFVASHLVRHPVSPEQISTVIAITRRAILDTYRLFYPERETVIDRECLFLLREDPRRAALGSLPSLAWPPPGYTDAFWEIIASRLEFEHGSNVLEVYAKSLRYWWIGRTSMPTVL